MNPTPGTPRITPDAPRITLHRTDHPATEPAPPEAFPAVHRPGAGADLSSQQLALLAALIHNTTTPAAPQHGPSTHGQDTQRDTRVSGRAKDIALITTAGGGGLGAATAGIGYGSGLIAGASGGLMTAALALAIGTGSITAAVMLLRAAFKNGSTDTAGGDEQPTTHITQNIHAPGLFGRANGTINHH
ncbi:hypothetical protein [Streptomyces marincola]|uniref:Uncharacterized protein n=1 Tax=Streptomyces marincola TaxID=2878388 RepID=A0A1W7CRT2_9ACTN|nr:hypothetical protein [Streptomyces marincola]ARQ67498.1 hypothetical protein CAG99_00365 [Streptomyces marincola]